MYHLYTIKYILKVSCNVIPAWCRMVIYHRINNPNAHRLNVTSTIEVISNDT